MKELSIEEKAKAYDEAIEVAQRFYNNSVAITKKGLEDIFPELKESENDRIRKEILDYIRHNIASLTMPEKQYNSWVAWLEKQGEQKITLPKWKYKKDHAPLLRDSLILNKYGCVAKSPSGALVSDVWVIDYTELAKLPKEEIKKQGEQKPDSGGFWEGYNTAKEKFKQESADKVEPKFKPGDWVVCGQYGTPCQIESIKDGRYYFTSGIGIPVESVNIDYYLWTIQDARDGDVLFTSSTASNETFVFKNIDEKGNAKCYFAYDSEDGFREGKYHFIGRATDCKPATKEQRDLLFQKMKEAGYEWDADKKELKKIEQKAVQGTEPFEAEHGKYYYCIKDYFCGGKKQASKGDVVQALRGLPIMGLKDASEYFLPVNFIKYNSAWSEDDEEKLDRIISIIHCYTGTVQEENELTDWLKSLKDRVKPKQEWSEEEEEMLNLIIARLHSHPNVDLEEYSKEYDWLNFGLKSLRPQSTWKPSDKQMKAIGHICDGKYNVDLDILDSIYRDFKKLRK